MESRSVSQDFEAQALPLATALPHFLSSLPFFTSFPPCPHFPPGHWEEITHHKPSPPAELGGELISGPFFRVEFWALRSAGCVIWTRPGSSASPSTPSPGWTGFLRRVASPLGTTSGEPCVPGYQGQQAAFEFISGRNACWGDVPRFPFQPP